jgi:PAS domain S-box-containing protein
METPVQSAEADLQTALKEAKRREAEVAALFEASRAILEYLGFHEASRAIFNAAKKVIGATAGYIALLSQEGDENEVLFLDAGGVTCKVDPSLPMPIQGFRALAYQTGEAIYHNDFPHCEYASLLPSGHAPLVNVLFSPLKIEGRAVGLLGLANKDGGFTENDARLATAFAEFAAIALVKKRTAEEKERLVERLQEQARAMGEANKELKARAQELAEQNKTLNALAGKLEGERQRWQGFVQASPLPIISIDCEAKVASWNPAAEAMFGWRAEEVLGRELPIIPPGEKDRFKKSLKREFQGKVWVGQEVRRQRRDGTLIDVSLSTAFMHDAAGKVSSVIGIFEDITTRKQHQEDLRRERDRLVSLLDAMEDGVYIVSRDYDIEYVNPALVKVFGQVAGRKCYEYFHDRQEACPWCKNPEVFAGQTVRWEWYSPKNQRTYDLLDTPLRNSDGTVSKLEIFRDVTERKAMEEALKEARARTAAILDSISDCFFALDQDMVVTYYNRAAETVLGRKAEEVLGERLFDAFPEARGSIFEEKYAEALRTGQGTAFEAFFDVPPFVNWYEVRVYPFGQGISVFFQATTERKQAEEALRRAHDELELRVEERTAALSQSEALLSKVLQTLPVGVWVADQEGRIIMGNAAGHEIWGGARYVGVEHYGEYQGWWADTGKKIAGEEWALARALQKGETSLGEVVEIQAFDGRRKTILNSAVPIYKDNHEIIGAIVVNQDITAQRQAEKELQEKTNLNQILLDNMPAVALLVRPHTREVVACNRAAREIGIAPGTRCFASWSKLESPCPWCRAVKLWETGEPQMVEMEFEARFYEAHWVQVEPDLCIHFAVDITEHKLSEEALRASELQLKGLAAKLITTQEEERSWISRELHDELGQSLIILKYQLSSLEEKILTDYPALGQDCRQLLEALDDVIGKVRSVSRDLSPGPVRELGLTGALKFLLEQFGKHADIQDFSLDMEKIDHLLSRTTQINIYRIFQESLTNIGRHAQATKVAVSVKRKGDQVSFTIRDNGKGFEVDQVFSPLAAAKGVGLAAMQERVSLAGGTLEIWSKKGKGTRISFTIPIGRTGGENDGAL